MVRVVYVPFNDKIWFDYYHEQARQVGHGISGFQGMPYQRGSGLGSFFGRLFRSILPVAKRVGKSALMTIGREAVDMGSNVLNDLTEGRNFKQTLQDHGKKAGQNLVKKAVSKITNQSGGRIGKRKVVSTVQSVKKRPRLQKQKKQDIFTSDESDGENY